MMLHALKHAALRAAAAAGVPRRLGPRLVPGGLAVLMYHGVTAEPLPVPDWCFVPAAEFRAQLAYLARHCQVLPLAAAVATLRAEGRLAGPPAVALTFDDGYQNNIRVALPLLREFGLPATIFLNTGFIGTRAALWFCRLHAALSTTAHAEVEFAGRRLPLRTAAERAHASAALQGALKTLPHAALLAATATLLDDLGADPDAPLPVGSPYAFMDEADVAEGLASGLLEFGAHTRGHTILAHLPPGEQQQQIEGSVRDVERLTGRPCRTFAYPNGRAEDYGAEALRLVRGLGLLAVTTEPRANTAASDPARLGRYGIGAGTPLPLFQAQVHHLLTRGRA